MWKKIVDSKELVIYEKKQSNIVIKIEARLSDNEEWEIFKKYCAEDDLNYVENFVAQTKEDLNFIMKNLMKKNLGKKDLKEIKLKSTKIPKLSLKRDFKEYCMEKWVFTVDIEKTKNLLFLKYDEIIEIDIILYEKYKPIKDKIINEITNVFSLNEEQNNIKTNIYYYSSKDTKETINKENSLIGKLEIGFE
jgi:hypothetical protein